MQSVSFAGESKKCDQLPRHVFLCVRTMASIVVAESSAQVSRVANIILLVNLTLDNVDIVHG